MSLCVTVIHLRVRSPAARIPAADPRGCEHGPRRARSATHGPTFPEPRTEQLVSNSGESIATPLVRGILAAAVSLGTALAIAVVPALTAQVAGTESSASVLDAILIALNLLVLGHGGGVVLDTGVIAGSATLPPLGLTLLLALVAALGMRRVGTALELVEPDGLLRERALRDAGGALGAYAGVYAAGMGLVAAASRGGEVAPVVISAVVSAALVSLVGGLTGLLWSLRREGTSTVPGVRVLDLLPSPADAVARSTAIAVLGLLGAGMALVLVLMLTHLPAEAALHQQLGPGVVGGLVLTLLQLALLPLFAVWGTCVLLGGTVSVGTATGLSLGSITTGVLPALPVLAALPAPGELPWWSWGLPAVPVAVVALGAVRLVRDTAALGTRERITAWVAYPLAVSLVMLLIAGLATGGIGEGRLMELGPRLPGLVLPLLGITVGSTAAVVALLGTGAGAWLREAPGRLRERVERAEDTERAERGTGSDTGRDASAEQTSDGDAPR